MYNISTLMSLSLIVAAFSAPAAAYAQQPLTTPYTIAMTSQQDLDTWTTYDVDGNVEGEKATWFIGNADMGGSCAASYTDAVTYKDTDNWLVSPAITLEAGRQYVLSFTYYASYYNNENLDILLSAEPEPETPHTTVKECTIEGGFQAYYGSRMKILLPEITETRAYHLTLRHYATGNQGMVIFVKDISVDILGYGNLTVSTQVYDNSISGNRPLEGVTVTAAGTATFTGVTDSEGKCYFTDIPDGPYSVVASKHGFMDSYPATYTVEAGKTTESYPITMSEMARDAVVTGAVSDSKGNPVEGALVSLDGYDHYTTRSAADGTFRIEGIYNTGYQSMTYNLTASKNNFEPTAVEVNVVKNYYEPEISAGTLKLKYKALRPDVITAKTEESSVKLSWDRPVDHTLLKIDNGVVGNNPLGFPDSRGTNFLGVIYPTPMSVNRLEWYRMTLENYDRPSDAVNVFIMGLDKDGKPSGEMLLFKEGVESPLDEWTTLELDTPVEAPNGFMLGMTANGYMSLARDTNGEVVAGDRQVYGNSYEYTGSYYTFADNGWTGAMMLRAEGETIETGSFAPQIKYNLYRFDNTIINDPSSANHPGFDLLAKETDTTAFTDDKFGTLPQGIYRYAVEAVYPVDGLVSPITISEPVYRSMFTGVTVNVSTDSDPADSDGATVTLSSDIESYKAVVKDGKASFDKVFKYIYTLTAEQPGFESSPMECQFINDDTYEVSASLRQILAPVDNIDIENSDGRAILRWDLFRDIAEGFEGDDFPDFAVNPAGRMGWSYIDNDGLPTYGFGATTFPGMRKPMAAIVMNSSSTQPPLGLNVARTGSRALACFAAYPTEIGDGVQLNHSDDYIISPRLDFHRDFRLSFWAMTYQAQEGRLETFRVGYSTTTPDLDQFEFITDYIEVPEYDLDQNIMFTKFSFDIPKSARYVTVNSYSDDVFMLLIDDIEIGTGITHSGKPAAGGKVNGYAVYLDGVRMAETTEKSFEFTDLAEGPHTASVAKLYRSGASEQLSVDFNFKSGIIENIAEGISISCNNRMLSISGEYNEASVWTPAGQCVMTGIAGNGPVDLSALAAGVYVVKASVSGARPATSKIVLR